MSFDDPLSVLRFLSPGTRWWGIAVPYEFPGAGVIAFLSPSRNPTAFRRGGVCHREDLARLVCNILSFHAVKNRHEMGFIFVRYKVGGAGKDAADLPFATVCHRVVRWG